jgi:hypothetical protein
MTISACITATGGYLTGNIIVDLGPKNTGGWWRLAGQLEWDLHRDFGKVAFRAGGASRQVALAEG